MLEEFKKNKEFKKVDKFLRILLFFALFYVCARFIITYPAIEPIASAIALFTLIYFIVKTYYGGM